MKHPAAYERLDPAQLVDVILTQADIVRLGMDIAAVMALVTERCILLTNGDGAAIELLEDGHMVYRATSGIAWAQLGLRLNANSSLSGYCVSTGEVVYCPDVELDPRVDLAACRKIGLQSMIVLPLRHAGVPVGVLKVMSRQRNAFGDNDRLVLELLGELVGSVMFHAGGQGRDELNRVVTRDLLTGLPNRALLFDLLRRRTGEAARYGEQFGLLRLVLDKYRDIQADAGHPLADAALQEAAQRLSRCAREGDVVARVAEDGFAVLLNRLAAPDQIGAIAERFLQALAAPFVSGGQTLSVAARYGHAVFPDDGRLPDELYERAAPASRAA